jgi:hypothetical protein
MIVDAWQQVAEQIPVTAANAALNKANLIDFIIELFPQKLSHATSK